MAGNNGAAKRRPQAAGGRELSDIEYEKRRTEVRLFYWRRAKRMRYPRSTKSTEFYLFVGLVAATVSV